jgi:hypothetical protein
MHRRTDFRFRGMPSKCENLPVSNSSHGPADTLGLLRWQFDLTWSLFEYHLERLEPDDFLWEPAVHHWTMRSTGEGWSPDWSEVEPEPVPVPTIAWLTWHIGWWWSTAISHASGTTPPEREAVIWPGPGKSTLEWLRGLREEWVAALKDLAPAELGTIAPFPWRDDPQHTIGHMLAWVNAELMKNIAEIGQIRLQRAAAGS